MLYSLLDQFRILPIVSAQLGNYDLFFTNSTLILVLSLGSFLFLSLLHIPPRPIRRFIDEVFYSGGSFSKLWWPPGPHLTLPPRRSYPEPRQPFPPGTIQLLEPGRPEQIIWQQQPPQPQPPRQAPQP